jgi:hypothetical protein
MPNIGKTIQFTIFSNENKNRKTKGQHFAWLWTKHGIGSKLKVSPWYMIVMV